jgi:FecR-like protein
MAYSDGKGACLEVTRMLKARVTARWALLGALLIAFLSVGYDAWRKPMTEPPRIRHLEDATVASLGADTRFIPEAGFPARREASLDGEALLRVSAIGRPLIVRTRLMRLEVLGSSTLAITARSRESGEEVEVLDGEVIVSKNYPSSYRVPDDLHGGEMSMVNATIDLMEKEHMDPASLESIRERARALN